ncbi:unnamed protein product [Prorocentrum cordatum]|uniref:Uncharacterized protein n=1 Tax=Prorocentrum cordatum TaxID=2364126 RepID=A0ABN9TSB3_9DINO|nr:unnamed protein product [Polarella glacialis]
MAGAVHHARLPSQVLRDKVLVVAIVDSEMRLDCPGSSSLLGTLGQTTPQLVKSCIGSVGRSPLLGELVGRAVGAVLPLCGEACVHLRLSAVRLNLKHLEI